MSTAQTTIPPKDLPRQPSRLLPSFHASLRAPVTLTRARGTSPIRATGAPADPSRRQAADEALRRQITEEVAREVQNAIKPLTDNVAREVREAVKPLTEKVNEARQQNTSEQLARHEQEATQKRSVEDSRVIGEIQGQLSAAKCAISIIAGLVVTVVLGAAAQLYSQGSTTWNTVDEIRKRTKEIQEGTVLAQRAQKALKSDVDSQLASFASGQTKSTKSIEDLQRLTEQMGGSGTQPGGTPQWMNQPPAYPVILVLQSRSLPISPDQRTRILACKNLMVVSRWLSRVATITETEQVFE